MPTTSDRDILTGPGRVETWTWRVLDLAGGYRSDLDGVESASLSFSNAATIKTGGKLTYRGGPQDWLHMRIQPVYTVTSSAGTLSWPMGVFIPATPGVDFDDGERTEQVELYDRLQQLAQDAFPETVIAPVGANLAQQAASFIYGSVPDAVVVADPTDLVLSESRVWEAGTTVLRAVNDLLDAANFFSCWVDGAGRFRLDHYTPPAARPPVWDFVDDARGIYVPQFSREQDLFDVPNRVVVVGQERGDDPALVGVAENTDPSDPASFPSRGRWVTTVDTGFEASTQQQIDDRAARRLSDLASPAATLSIEHAMVPMTFNDVVTFRRDAEGVAATAVVQSFEVDTAVGGLVKTNLQEVSA